jgi:hypothetical protein
MGGLLLLKTNRTNIVRLNYYTPRFGFLDRNRVGLPEEKVILQEGEIDWISQDI